MNVLNIYYPVNDIGKGVEFHPFYISATGR